MTPIPNPFQTDAERRRLAVMLARKFKLNSAETFSDPDEVIEHVIMLLDSYRGLLTKFEELKAQVRLVLGVE